MILALAKLALRNVLRNRRRSGITLASVVIGLAALFFQQSLLKSLQADMIDRAINVFNSHLQIQAKDSENRKIPEVPFSNAGDLELKILSHPEVAAVSKRVLFTGLIASPANSVGIGIFGVDFFDEEKISNIGAYVKKGKFLNGPRQVVIGSMVARKLDIRVGEKVVIMTQNRHGSLDGISVRVVGIYETGSYTWDATLIYMDKTDAQKILAWQDDVNSIAIRIKDITKLEPTQDWLISSLRSSPHLTVLTWKDIASEIVHIQDFQDAVLILVLVVIFIIVALGILNTMLMSLFERIREFGLILALGAKRHQVIILLLAESAWLGITGLFWGALLGILIITYFHYRGMPLPLGEALSYLLPFEKTIYLRFAWKNHFAAGLCVILVSLVAGLIPAIRIAKLKIADALRHV